MGTQTRQPIAVDDSDDDVQVISWASRPQTRPAPADNSAARAQQRSRRRHRPNPGHIARNHIFARAGRPWPPHPRDVAASMSTNTLPPLFVHPGQMNYDQAAFSLGNMDDDTMQWEPFPVFEDNDVGQSADYPTARELLPLPNVRAGFTRDPREQDELVCPNCDGELCNSPVPPFETTNEDAQRLSKEVWVVRECGHVYCGLCADEKNRKAAPQRKGKAKDLQPSELGLHGRKRLKECVVEACGVKTTAKNAVFQVYL
ncbi:MAG: hypothetical protein Q9159_001143 [Coniocarpon cinnabarinum]